MPIRLSNIEYWLYHQYDQFSKNQDPNSVDTGGSSCTEYFHIIGLSFYSGKPLHTSLCNSESDWLVLLDNRGCGPYLTNHHTGLAQTGGSGVAAVWVRSSSSSFFFLLLRRRIPASDQAKHTENSLTNYN